MELLKLFNSELAIPDILRMTKKLSGSCQEMSGYCQKIDQNGQEMDPDCQEMV